MKEKIGLIVKKNEAFVNEFKKFALKGNVVDMAVGVIIGAAFGKIVSSLVTDILMPIIGIILGGINLNDLTFTAFGKVIIKYGIFLQNIVDFIIIAFSIFIFIKLLSKFNRKKEEEAAPKKAEDILLLEEIRDLLKNQNATKVD
jgi:large conductance mechanosensitive channel